MICYHSPRDIIDTYEFDVELLAQSTTSMHGSKEGHMGYIYKRRSRQSPKRRRVGADEEEVPCDDLFRDSWKLVMSGLEPLRQKVNSEMKDTMRAGRATRARRGPTQLTREI